MRNIVVIVCLALICSACSQNKTDAGAVSPSALATAPGAPEADAQPAEAQPEPEVVEEPAAEPDIADDWPVQPLPSPLSELKSDYWASPADGYFPEPMLKNKKIPAQDWECSADQANEWLTCDYNGKQKPDAIEAAYRKQLEEGAFEEGGRGDFYKDLDGHHVRVARVNLEGFGDGGSRLTIAFGTTLDPNHYYAKMPDARMVYPLSGKLSASPSAVLEIAGNPDKITTYVYEQFNQFFLPNYEKRLESAGYKKDADHSVYIIKYEDGTFLSVAIEPNCYVWSIKEKFNRREQACVSMAKGRMRPVDPNDVIGLYKNLPDSSIPYPVDQFYQKAYKYTAREKAGDETVFTYMSMPKNIDYIKRLDDAGFKMTDYVESDGETAKSRKLVWTLEKPAADGQKLVVNVTAEDVPSSVSDHVYNRVTVRMSKRP